VIAFAAGSGRSPDLTMVVPTYNERDRIGELVQALFEACTAHHIALELIIVDDNSPDGTGAVADALASRYRVKVLHRAGKLGLGTAVVEGFAAASAGIVGVMDADFSHPPAFVPRMLATFNATSADVVVASRYVPGGSSPNWPLRRRLLSRTACLMARPLTPIRDAASGFFLIRHDIATGVSIKAGGFKICLELLVRAWPTRIVELPYRFDDRELGESKMSLREAAGYLVQLWDLYRMRLRGPRRERRTYQPIAPDRVEALLAARTASSALR
jgi:dolichol-phosphate mannosyltransferase